MTFVVERVAGGLGGCVEIASRSIAEGCATSPVAYIEFLFVGPDLRRSRSSLAPSRSPGV